MQGALGHQLVIINLRERTEGPRTAPQAEISQEHFSWSENMQAALDKRGWRTRREGRPKAAKNQKQQHATLHYASLLLKCLPC